MSTIDNYQHIVFRTKYSRNTIPNNEKRVLLSYIYKVSIEMGVIVLRLNCYLNHVHIFVNIPGELSISDYVRKIKGTSSKAFRQHEQFPLFDGWARKFASFSKSKEDTAKVINYIKNQEEHHRHKTFQEELETLFGTDFFQDPYNRRDWLDESTTLPTM